MKIKKKPAKKKIEFFVLFKEKLSLYLNKLLAFPLFRDHPKVVSFCVCVFSFLFFFKFD
jgi:hypothetical protein